MPTCEMKKCGRTIGPNETREDNGKVVCESCFGATVTPIGVKSKEKLFLGRELNFDFGYTNKDGAKAELSLGGAKLSLSISQEELTRTFGPSKS